MKHRKSQHAIASSFPVIAAAIVLTGPSFADTFPFRVTFKEVPGIEEIEAGDIPAGIKVLENQLSEGDPAIRGDVLATLCAAYVVNLSLDKAESACNDAVEISPSDTAYNNRGVYRAFKGDFAGARRDFDRARPRQIDEYLEYLNTRDVGLIANTNHELLEQLSARHAPDDVNTSVALSSSALEDVTR